MRVDAPRASGLVVAILQASGCVGAKLRQRRTHANETLKTCEPPQGCELHRIAAAGWHTDYGYARSSGREGRASRSLGVSTSRSLSCGIEPQEAHQC